MRYGFRDGNISLIAENYMDIKYIKILCLMTISTLSYAIFEGELEKETENYHTDDSQQFQKKTHLPTSWQKTPKKPEKKPSKSTEKREPQKLIENKKNAATVKIKSEELLRIAKTNATAEQIEKLLDQGADINFKDKEGKTALHWACTYGHFKAVETLIYNGADIHARDYMGSTPLHAVAKHLTPRPKEREKIITLLFKFGASIYDKDYQDRNVLEISDGQALQRFLVRRSLRHYT